MKFYTDYCQDKLPMPAVAAAQRDRGVFSMTDTLGFSNMTSENKKISLPIVWLSHNKMGNIGPQRSKDKLCLIVVTVTKTQSCFKSRRFGV